MTKWCAVVLPQMERQGSGAIVNVSSMAAVRFSDTYPLLAYSASKAGVNGVTQSIAMQYAAKGVRVNAIMPGLIDTPIAIDDPVRRAATRGLSDGGCGFDCACH